MSLGFLYKINLRLCSCMEYKLQEESSCQLNLLCLFFQAFFLVYALGCLSIYYGEVRDWVNFGLPVIPLV